MTELTALTGLTTARLHLRKLQRGDAAFLHAWLSDPAVMRFWSTLPHDDFATTERWVELSLAESAAGRAHDYVVLREGVIVGRVAFWSGNEIGFFFGPAYQGQGYASEALAAFCRFGLTALGFDEIRADVDPGNAASLRVLERIGFSRTGFAENTMEIGGKWVDSIYLALRR